MKEQVRIRISGAEGTEEQQFSGFHIERDGEHRLFYKEEGNLCRIRISKDEAEIRRPGTPLSELIIRRNEFTDTVVSQSFGSIGFRVRGEEICVQSEGVKLCIELAYTLYQGASPAFRNLVRITVTPDGEHS